MSVPDSPRPVGPQPAPPSSRRGCLPVLLALLGIVLTLPVAFRRSAEGDRMRPEKRLFGYSVIYLFALFAALVEDRMILGHGSLA